MGQPAKVLSLNVQGLNNKKKRNVLFRLIKKEGIQIAALQETHITEKDLDMIRKEWGGLVHESIGTNRSKGLLTLFDKSLHYEDTEIIEKTERMIISATTIHHQRYFIINIYSPCVENEKERFFRTAEKIIRDKINTQNQENIICLGDFNNVLNNDLDIISGQRHSRKSVDSFKHFVNTFSLTDIWRTQHNDLKAYTWSRNNPLFIARRLDYILVGEGVVHYSEESYIKSLGFSDHRAVILKLNPTNFKRGPGTYKMNTTLLKDKIYVQMINTFLENAVNEFNDLNPILKWEMIKIRIKEISQQYSRFIHNRQKNILAMTLEDLDTIERKLANEPKNRNLLVSQSTLKKEIEIRAIEETRGAKLRSGNLWIKEGEKCSKLFLGLERTRAKSNLIFSLRKLDGNVTNEYEEILDEIATFYEDLYTESKTEIERLRATNRFMENLQIPTISEEERNNCEESITENELYLSLKEMKNNSSPGSDGIPTEFYKFFWAKLKHFLKESFSFGFAQGCLAPTQKHGIISLLHKGKDLPKEDLNNWRPISLTNTDYKILTKTLATRLSKVLNKLVHRDQSGFIKGRDIACTLRELADIIEYERKSDGQSFVLAIDFKKAFDTISMDFIIKAIGQYGFGENFIKWIKVILNNRTASVKNGGHISREFSLERGVRQGCPLSPLIFVLAVEIMAISIRTDSRIKGIKLPCSGNGVKVKQFADDTTLLLRDSIDFREVLAKIKQFSHISGLELNKKKCEAIPLGTTNDAIDHLEGIKIVNTSKILGVYFSNYKSPEDIDKNWTDKIQKLENILTKWSIRDLSIIGKIHILKTFGLSIFIYLMRSIGIPTEVLHKINTLFYRFVWKKKVSNAKAFEKVKRTVMEGPLEMGGLKMVNIKQMQTSMYLEWAEKLINGKTHEWSEIPRFWLKKVGGTMIFKTKITVQNIKGINNVKNMFWRNVVESWVKNNTFVADSNIQQNVVNEPIANNENITYNNNVLLIDEFISRNIMYVNDLVVNNRLMTYHEFIRRYGVYANAWIDYFLVRNALTNKCLTGGVQFARSYKFKNINVGKIGRKGFDTLLSHYELSHGSKIWNRLFQIELTKEHWTIAPKCTAEVRLQILQWKILHNIYPTNILLNKMGVRESNLCSTCKVVDHTEHFFYFCNISKPLWQEIQKQILIHTNINIKLDAKRVMLGISKDDITKENIRTKINHALLVGKMVISKIKYGKRRHIIDTFNTEALYRNIWIV